MSFPKKPTVAAAKLSKKSGPNSQKAKHDLSAQAHKQVMELLRIAEKSANPEIAKCAIKMAEAMGQHQRSQSIKIHPGWVAALATIVIVAGMGGCWYAFINYPQPVARAISWSVFGFVLILVALYALLGGALSQENFTRILNSLLLRAQKLWPFESKTHAIESDDETTD